MGRPRSLLFVNELEGSENPYWTTQELASFSTHPGTGRVLNVRPGDPSDTSVELTLRNAGYCTGRLAITRDPSHLPLAAATFGPNLIYVSLESPLSMCLDALEVLAADERTSNIPLVALVPEQAPSTVIEEAYSRAGCDFFRLGTTEIELLARTHLIVRLSKRSVTEPFNQRPSPQPANSIGGTRLDLRDSITGAYTHTYLRHRLPIETARALRYQRDLSIAVVRCREAATSDALARQVSAALGDSSRGVDLVARAEADLFVVVMPETGSDGAHTVQERIEGCMRPLNLPFQVGIASLGNDGSSVAYSADTLLQLACARADD